LGLLTKFISIVLEWGARVAAGLALLYSLYLIMLQNFWIGPLGGTSPFSLGSASVLYLLSQYQFARSGRGKLDSMVLGVLFANAFLQIYEIIYHFTFPIYSLTFPFVQGADIKFLAVELSMVLPLILVRKELSFKKISAYALGAFLFCWAIWILFGFPQYFSATYYIKPLLHTADPFHVSLALNYGSKVILAAFFLTLLRVWQRGPPSWWGRTAKAASTQETPIHMILPRV
jgi:hypothetical protein